MVREHVAAEGKEKVFRFVRPRMRWHYHPKLAFHARLEWESRDFKGEPLSPEQVAAIDWHWRQDLQQIGQLLDFHRRPSTTRPGYRSSRSGKS